MFVILNSVGQRCQLFSISLAAKGLKVCQGIVISMAVKFINDAKGSKKIGERLSSTSHGNFGWFPKPNSFENLEFFSQQFIHNSNLGPLSMHLCAKATQIQIFCVVKK